MNNDFWKSFREEIIATSLILGLVAISSFFLASRLFNSPELELNEQTEALTQEEISKQLENAVNSVLGESEVKKAVAVATTDKPLVETPLSSTPINPMDSEIVSGLEGQYSFDDYQINFNRPRKIFNLQTADSRRFKVDVILKNVNITQGLPLTLKAEVIKDGSVIVSEAVMSSSVSKILMPGEEIEFEASISLIDGTDVSKLFYEVAGVSDKVDHLLQRSSDG